MLSIIIPCYNGAEWLEEAIESALIQRIRNYKDFVFEYITPEIIVVDDGSTDNSAEIAKKYPIKLISQANKGLASARNTGIMNTNNKWILFLDADDKLLPNAGEKISLYIESEVNIIAPSFKEFGISDREVVLMSDPKLEDFRTGNRLGYCAAIRKSALLAVGGYSPRMIEGYEDLHLWINLLSRGFKIKTIPDILWLYRTKEQSMYRSITPEVHTKLLAQINKDFPEARLDF